MGQQAVYVHSMHTAHGAKQGLWEDYANMLVETLRIRQVLMYLKFFPIIIIIIIISNI